MADNDGDRTREIGYYSLELLDKQGSLTSSLLYSRLDDKFDLAVNEFAPVMDQLRTLELIGSFDGGHATVFEITRKGVCELVDDEAKMD